TTLFRSIWLRANELAERNKFVSAKLIAFVLLRPTFEIFVGLRRFVMRVGPEVHSRRTLVACAAAVAPVVLIGKAATRITHHARLQLLQIIDQRFTNAVVVRDLRLHANPNSVIDDTTEMFDEVTVSFRRDCADGF